MRLSNRPELNRYISEQSKVIERILVRRMEVLVEELINHAKESAEYEDQTSNLKGSIGGVVLKAGKPISYRGFDEPDDKDGKGKSTGFQFINDLINEYKKDYVILIVAGMEYASFVENYHKRNVLKESELKLDRELPSLLDYVRRLINTQK